jgi:hypothetical protein
LFKISARKNSEEASVPVSPSGPNVIKLFCP